MNVTAVTASGVAPSAAKICMFAVHVPVCTPAGSSCVYDSVLGFVSTLAVVETMFNTERSGCCSVILHTVEPLPADVCRTKLNFTELPRANDVCAAPVLGFTVPAVLPSVAWLTVYDAVPLATVKLADAALFCESVAVIVTFPVGVPAGIVAYAMKFAVAIAAGDVGTIWPPIWMNIAVPEKPLPMSCTVVPAGPVAGVTMSVGVVSAKYAVALLP